MKQIKMLILIISLLIPMIVHSQNISNYLIQSDIGNYKRITKGGPSGDILAGVNHFSEDHQDESSGISYHNKDARLWIDVQVTQHSGSDSDKWLLHELDLEFRNYYGKPGYYIKTISGNTVYVYGAGGRDYRWLSGNKVVMIEYIDSQLTKPEPLEIIQVYLLKYPSTISAITVNELYSNPNKTKWTKDEMDRRLWLCDKWFYQMQLGKAQQNQVFQESVNSMNVFLDYREKYFGIKAADDKILLAAYLSKNNGTGIKSKLAAYKKWWSENKGKSITVP